MSTDKTASFAHIGVVGGGAWGTALAQCLAATGKRVTLWAYETETVKEINAHRTNSVFLPGVSINAGVTATGTLGDIAGTDLILMVPPAQHLGRIAGQLAAASPGGLAGDGSPPLVICAKGIEAGTGRLLGACLKDAVPDARMAVLSGPSFAGEVARGLPAALTVASQEEALGAAIARALGSRTLRLYWTSDVVGVQLGGAVKNVLAIAAGIVDGAGLGRNAHAALVTRGFAELRRFSEALGARTETLMGLAGLGDLLLTCGSAQSRNMSLGRALGEGRAIGDVLGERRAVTEGVYTAEAVVEIAEANGIEVPISRAVHDIVCERVSVRSAIDELMQRPLKAED